MRLSAAASVFALMVGCTNTAQIGPGTSGDPNDAASAGPDDRSNDADAASVSEPDAVAPPDADAEAAVDPDTGAPDADPADATETADAEAGVDAVADATPDASADAGPTPTPRTSVAALFTGHSLIDNPLPDDFESIATSQGKTVNWEQQNMPGSPISARTRGSGNWAGYSAGKNASGQGMNILAELANPSGLPGSQTYDTLIITERHDILATILYEDTMLLLRHYHDRVVEHDPNARTLFSQGWLDIDRADPQEWIDYTRTDLTAWECTASFINLTLQRDGQPGEIEVVPAGEALALLVDRALNGQIQGLSGTQAEILDEVFTDNVHLHRPAIYLSAAVHYAFAYDDSPVGAAAPAGLSAALADEIQRLAWEVYTTYDRSKSTQTNLSSCRQIVSTQHCPQFWTRIGRPDMVGSCDYWSVSDVFRWPNAGFQALPAP